MYYTVSYLVEYLCHWHLVQHNIFIIFFQTVFQKIEADVYRGSDQFIIRKKNIKN